MSRSAENRVGRGQVVETEGRRAPLSAVPAPHPWGVLPADRTEALEQFVPAASRGRVE